MKTILARPLNRALSTNAGEVNGLGEAETAPEIIEECVPLRDFIALFRSRWNCAILHALRPRGGQSPPQLRRFQVNRSLSGAVERSVSNALDTLEDAGLVERLVPMGSRATLYRLTEDGLAALPLLREVRLTCKNSRALLNRAHAKHRAGHRRRNASALRH